MSTPLASTLVEQRNLTLPDRNASRMRLPRNLGLTLHPLVFERFDFAKSRSRISLSCNEMRPKIGNALCLSLAFGVLWSVVYSPWILGRRGIGLPAGDQHFFCRPTQELNATLSATPNS